MSLTWSANGLSLTRFCVIDDDLHNQVPNLSDLCLVGAWPGKILATFRFSDLKITYGVVCENMLCISCGNVV